MRQGGDPSAALRILDEAAGEFPEHPLIHFNRGSLLAGQARYEEAARALQTGLALDPDHPEARLTLAKALVRARRFEAALVEIDRYAALVGELLQGFDAHYVRGLALRHLDRLEDAERELRRAVETDSRHADALLNLGAVLELRGSATEALDVLREAASLHPDNPDVRYRLGQLLLRKGETEAGRTEIAAFERLKRSSERESRVAGLLEQAERSMAGGNLEQARDLYLQAIREDPASAEAHANLGVAYEQLGQGGLAEEMFRKALELRPDYAEAHLNLGLKRAANGRFAEALQSLDEALRLAPENAAARQGLAMVLTRLQRPLEAVLHFEALARAFSASAEAHLNLGIALAEGGRLEDALGAFREAARLAPEEFRPLYNLGRALNDLGRLPEARTALESAVARNERFSPALHLLGTIERTAGNAARAVELLRSAAELDPDNAAVHYDLGLALAESGSPQEAAIHWERALALDPRHREALYNLSQVLAEVDAKRAAEYRRRFAALKAQDQDTDRAGTLWNFALAEAKRERWERAFDLFRQALDACGGCPAKGQIHKNFGLTYGHAGDFANAEAELVRALALLPDDQEIKFSLDIVRQSLAEGREPPN